MIYRAIIIRLAGRGTRILTFPDEGADIRSLFHTIFSLRTGNGRATRNFAQSRRLLRSREDECEDWRHFRTAVEEKLLRPLSRRITFR